MFLRSSMTSRCSANPGVDLALRFSEMVAIAGPMPDGGTNRVEIAVASIPALLAMKGFALIGRHKQKDAYDIYYCVRNYPAGIEALADACRPLLDTRKRQAGLFLHRRKIQRAGGYGLDLPPPLRAGHAYPR